MDLGRSHAALFAAVMLFAVFSGNVWAAAPPDPPAQLCIDNVCSATTSGNTGSAGSGVKWHPGHYVLSDTRPTRPAMASGIYSSAMSHMAAAGSPQEGFRGFQGEYSWFYLETARGVYNTSLIDQDLAYLAALSAKYGRTFRLIIYLETEGFATASRYAVPQGDPYGAAGNSLSIAPDYILTGISGYGSDVVNGGTGAGSYPGSWAVLALWRPAVMDRWIALLTYLGSKYDSNPYVEAIIPLSETGVNLANVVANDRSYSNSNHLAQWERLGAAMKASWPTTNKILFNNWNPTGGTIADLASLTANFAGSGFGMGGPDILYGSYKQSFGSQIAIGAGGQYGSTKYIGQIPLLYNEQADYSNWTAETAAGIESYTFDTLAATHVVWGDHGANSNASQSWPAVVAALSATHFRIHSGCPAAYSGACNVN
jgi:hypothetical protein